MIPALSSAEISARESVSIRVAPAARSLVWHAWICARVKQHAMPANEENFDRIEAEVAKLF